MAAVGDRNARIGQRSDRRGDPGDHLEVDAGFGAGARLLAAASEDERIAALEPDDSLALAGEPQQQRGGFVLGTASGASWPRLPTLWHMLPAGIRSSSSRDASAS